MKCNILSIDRVMSIDFKESITIQIYDYNMKIFDLLTFDIVSRATTIKVKFCKEVRYFKIYTRLKIHHECDKNITIINFEGKQI